MAAHLYFSLNMNFILQAAGEHGEPGGDARRAALLPHLRHDHDHGAGAEDGHEDHHAAQVRPRDVHQG